MIRPIPRLPLPALLLVAAALSGCFTDDKGSAGTPEGLSGQVRLGGSPAVEAMVRAYPVDYRPGAAGADPDPDAYYSTTTGAGGVYAFTDVPAGKYNIIASRNGLVAFLDSVAVTGTDQSLPRVTLGEPGTLVGQVELQPQHSTLGAVVEVLGTPVYAEVDEDGGFELTGLAAGTYRLRAHSDLPDYTPDYREAAVPTGSADTLAAPLRPPYSGTPHPGLSGRIRDSYGDAAVGATVWACPADFAADFAPGDTATDSLPEAIFSATTGAGGLYVFNDIPKGVYNILASRNSWKAYRSGVEVTGASQSLSPDTLKMPGLLAGRVNIQPGHPAIAMVVQVMGTPVVVTVDDEGHFQLPPLAPGTYRLRAHSTLIDYAPAYQEAVIESGTGYLLENPLDPVYSGAPARLLIGRLWTGRGPAVGTKVWVCPVDYVPGDRAADSASPADGYYTGTTGAGGIYTFTDVPAGLYNILIGNSIYRDSVTVTGAIQGLPFETARDYQQVAGHVYLQPNHSPVTARVQVFGTPVFVDVRDDSTFRLPIGPGTYRLRVHTSLPEYAPVIRDVVHPATGARPVTFRPRFSGIPVVVGLSAADTGSKGTVVFSWNKPDYGPVEAFLVYRDTVKPPDTSDTPDTAATLDTSATPYARVAPTDTAWIDTVYSSTPRAGQYDIADTAYHEHVYRVRILTQSGTLGPLFYSVQAKAVPPARVVDTIPQGEPYLRN